MKLNTFNDSIIFDDGFILLPPYEHPRYAEYVQFVKDGGTAEEINIEPVGEVPTSVTKFQGKAALMNMGMFDQVEQIIEHPDTPPLMKLVWREGQEFYRDSDFVKGMAQTIGLTEIDLDNLFIMAGKIKV